MNDQINIEGKDCLKNIYGSMKDLGKITCNWKKFCKLDELNKIELIKFLL